MESKKNSYKLRVGIFFGYNGKKYSGLQFVDDERIETVEKQLFRALIDSGFVLPQHTCDVKDVAWSRGARTDKGVHALCNLVAVKLNIQEDIFMKPITEEQRSVYEDLEKRAEEMRNNKKKNKKLQQIQNLKSVDKKKSVDYEKIRNVINSNLPSDMTVYKIKPVTNGFNVRHAARSRKYEYYIPLKIFQKYEDFQKNEEIPEEKQKEILEKIQDLFKFYEGTRNYHNFTVRIKSKDPEALCDNPNNGEKWVRIQLHGASFLYHMIRKMVGMVTMIFQKDLPKQFLENAFFMNHVSVWLAPAEGLFLNRIMFCGYNKKGDVPAPLLLEESDEVDVEKFRKYLQDDVVLTTSQRFDDYISHYMELTEEQLEQENQKEQEDKIDQEDE